jgi:hypothetical protein
VPHVGAVKSPRRHECGAAVDELRYLLATYSLSPIFTGRSLGHLNGNFRWNIQIRVNKISRAGTNGLTFL